MNYDILQPSQVIRIILEEMGVADPAQIADAVAIRLGDTLRSVSTRKARFVIEADDVANLRWGTVAGAR